MDNKLENLIQDIMEKNKGHQLTEKEYRYIASFLNNRNFLVFGLGYDSKLWRYANRNGFTVFLEHDSQWITNDPDVFRVQYTTKLPDADRLLLEYNNGNFENLTMKLPDIVLETEWDCIFVDSPQGYKKICPGRMQSIYSASILATKNTDVFVHDCDRRVEDIYSRTMFSKIINELTKLRHLKKE